MAQLFTALSENTSRASKLDALLIMPKRIIHLLIVILILSISACSSAAQSSQKTPVTGLSRAQLSQIDIHALLSQFLEEFELASGANALNLWDPLPPIYDDFPSHDNAFDRRFVSGDEALGGITVLLYQDEGFILSAYQQVIFGFGTEVHAEGYEYDLYGLNLAEDGQAAILEQALANGQIYRNTSLVFRRCHAVVEMNFAHIADLQLAAEFALAIDELISPAVCPGTTE